MYVKMCSCTFRLVAFTVGFLLGYVLFCSVLFCYVIHEVLGSAAWDSIGLDSFQFVSFFASGRAGCRIKKSFGAI